MENDFDESRLQKVGNNIIGNTINEQRDSIGYNGTTENTRSSSKDDRLFANNRFKNNQNDTNNRNGLEYGRKELDNSSFNLPEDIYNLKIKEIQETYKNGDKSITNQSLNELESKSNNIENNSNIEYNKENLDKDIDRITSKISWLAA